MSELVEPVVVCGEQAEQCICDEPPHHAPETPHLCKCGGSWRGTYGAGDFDALSYPKLVPWW